MITERVYHPNFIEEVELQLDLKVRSISSRHQLPRVVCVMLTQFDGSQDQVFTGSYLVPSNPRAAVRISASDLPTRITISDYLKNVLTNISVPAALITDTASMQKLHADDPSLLLLADDTGQSRLIGLQERPLTVFIED